MNLLIILAFILLAAFAGVLGYKRGLIWTGVRLTLLLICSFIAAAITSSVTNKILLSILGDKSQSSIYDVMAKLLYKDNSAIMPALNTAATGLTISVVKPFVFAILFLIGLLISLILYLIAKALIKRFCGAIILRECPIYLKILGALVGLLTGIYAMAIIISPIYIPVLAIDETKASGQIFKLIRHTVELQYDENYTSSKSSNAINNINKVEDIYNMFLRLPIGGVMKVTKAEDLAREIYNVFATVDSTDIVEKRNTQTEYNIITTINELFPLATAADDFISVAMHGNFLDNNVIEEAEKLFKNALDINLLTSDEKLILVNCMIDIINDEIDDLIIEGYVDKFEKYNSFEDFRNDIDNFFDLLDFIAAIDFDALLEDLVEY